MRRFTPRSRFILSLILHPLFVFFKDGVEFENCVDNLWHVWVVLRER